MRVRSLCAIALLLLPAAELSAQRLPTTRRRGPTRPAPLPPQAPDISRELSYTRLRVSFESYPMFSFVDAPGFTGNAGVKTWSSLGTGTRADYRINAGMSATLDVTSTFFGGPAITQTAELGTRFGAQRGEHRVYPFADVRVGYMYAYNTYFRPLDAAMDATAQPVGFGGRHSQGFGGIGGGGVEVALTRTISLATGASVMRSRLTSHGIQSPADRTDNFWMSSYRYTVGLRFNPVRVIRMPEPGSGP